jgi:hypothetical protein
MPLSRNTAQCEPAPLPEGMVACLACPMTPTDATYQTQDSVTDAIAARAKTEPAYRPVLVRCFQDPFGPQGWLRCARRPTRAEVRRANGTIERLCRSLEVGPDDPRIEYYVRGGDLWCVALPGKSGTRMATEAKDRLPCREALEHGRPYKPGVITPLKPLPAAEALRLLWKYWIGAVFEERDDPSQRWVVTDLVPASLGGTATVNGWDDLGVRSQGEVVG